MKTLLATTAALVLVMAVGARAAQQVGQLAAGPIYSGNTANSYCWYTNLGAVNITPIAQVMYSAQSNTVLSTSASCSTGSPLAPGSSCYITPNAAYYAVTCKVTFSTRVANVRGSLELIDSAGNEISQIEMR